MRKSLLFGILISLFIGNCNTSHAQTDTLFWFSVPYGSSSHSTQDANLTITATDSDNDTHIMITQPFVPNSADPSSYIDTIYITIKPGENMTWDTLFTPVSLLKVMNNNYVQSPIDPSPHISNSAIKIQSDRKITAYYEYNRTRNNPDIFSMKGTNALGTDFWIPFQNEWQNQTLADASFSQIIVVATKPNTVINVTFPKDAFGLPASTIPYTFTLAEPGQTLMFAPKDIGGNPSVNPDDHLYGTHITSNKPIAITTGDCSVVKGGWDMVGDQLVPTQNMFGEATIGYEYIVMKGELDNTNGYEKVYVLTTTPNTTVDYQIKGAGLVNLMTNAPAGFQGEISLVDGVPADEYVYIVADEPIYVWHVSGFGREVGGAIIPTIDGCTGSLDLSFVRSKDHDFYLNIMTHANAINNFQISFNGGAFLPFLSASDFEDVGIGDFWVLKDVSSLQNGFPIGVPIRIKNTSNSFHLGLLNGVQVGGGCIYGYFSDYNTNNGGVNIVASGSDIISACYGEKTEFEASGGISYLWTSDTGSDIYMNDVTIANPSALLPVGIHTFSVNIKGACNLDVNIPTSAQIYEYAQSNFSLNTISGDSPLEIELENLSTEADTFQIDWENDGVYDTFFNSSMPQTYNHTFIHTTDIDSVYTIRLKAWHRHRNCFDTYEKQITVHSNLNANFSFNSKIGCSPLSVNITNNSTGEDSIYIDYGDGSGFETNTFESISHMYTNTGTTVDTNIVQLMIKNNAGYKEYYNDTLIIFPEVNANFTIDGNDYSGCNSRNVVFTNTSNYGTHTASEFIWTFGDGLDSISNNTTINHEYINNTNNDIVYVFQLSAESQYGCTDDTANIITIYKALADFEINVDQGCSPLEVNVTNKSVGAQISSWDWDFDDLTTSIVQNPFPKTFKNSTGVNAIQNMQLTVTGTNGCNTSKTIPVTIFSSVDAQFTSDFKEGCNPLSVNFTNTSINASSNFWNFGNGETSTLSSPSHLYNNTNVYDKIFNVSLKIESENGCSDDTSALITVYSNILSDFTIDLKEGCSPLNTTINNTSFGNVTDTYQWFIDNILITGSPTNNSNFNPNFDNSGSTINNNEIKLIATNHYGCTSEHIDTITTYPKPVTEITDSSNVSCFGAEDGFVSVSVLSGIPPYVYMWSTGETNPILTGINGGIYTLTVSDVNACSSINTVIINEPPQTSIDIKSTDISCNGATDGTLAVTPNNEITSFLWSTGSTDSIISNLSSGLYAITVTNNDGCVSTGSYNILEPDSISIITDSYTESICSSQDGKIEISVYGGIPPYNYTWSSGENSQDIYNLNAGNYTISVVDINGCFSSKNYIIDSVSSYDEEICVVGVDPLLEMNEIVWDRTPDQGIIYYKLYRHNSNTDRYQNIALLSFNESGNFIDSIANIQNEAFKYKISSINKCAIESQLSNYHKSIYLKMINNSEIVMLEWEAYEIESGNPDIIGYIIYKGSDPTTLNPIDTISINETNYLDHDPEALLTKFYYRIAGVKSSDCILNTNHEPNLIYSNLVKNDINTNILNLTDQNINLNIFPNPFNNEVTIEYELSSKSNIGIEVYDIIGKKVTTLKKKKEEIGFHSHLFNPNDYGCSSGIYYIKLIIDNQIINKKIIQIN